MRNIHKHDVCTRRTVSGRPLKLSNRIGQRPPRAESRRPVRRGAILLLALICLLLVSMLGATIVNIATSQRRQQQSSQFRLQAESLAESGVQRAAAQLALNPQYAGETWEPEMGANAGKLQCVVRIVVVADERMPRQRHVTAVADFPHTGEHRARSRREMTIDL